MRPMRDNERALVELLLKIDRKYKDLVMIVEGKRDVNILRDLGVQSRIFRTQTKRTREETADLIAQKIKGNERVLILTDFDQEGIEIGQILDQALEIRKVKTLKRLRKEVRKLMGNWRCIEELAALFKRKDSPEPARHSV